MNLAYIRMPKPGTNFQLNQNIDYGKKVKRYSFT